MKPRKPIRRVTRRHENRTAYVRNQEEVAQEEEIKRIDRNTLFHLVGEINGSIAKLWKALTGLKDMPHMVDNIKMEHIKSTKEFRKRIADGVPRDDRIQVHNWIVWLEMALEDMREILDKADKTAFDR